MKVLENNKAELNSANNALTKSRLKTVELSRNPGGNITTVKANLSLLLKLTLSWVDSEARTKPFSYIRQNEAHDHESFYYDEGDVFFL